LKSTTEIIGLKCKSVTPLRRVMFKPGHAIIVVVKTTIRVLDYDFRVLVLDSFSICTWRFNVHKYFDLTNSDMLMRFHFFLADLSVYRTKILFICQSYPLIATMDFSNGAFE